MNNGVWTGLLEAMREAHDASAAATFCAFPTDLTPTRFTGFDHPASQRFQSEELGSTPFDKAVNAARAAAPLAHWRETYKETNIGSDFMERFGCYCLIGPNAPWTSACMYGFFVYMPAGLWYPWHEHPAEEMYLVLAGEGVFLREADRPERLGPGGASIHASGQPHALLTEGAPVLAWVIWRNGFETPPVLTPGRSLTQPPDLEALS